MTTTVQFRGTLSPSAASVLARVPGYLSHETRESGLAGTELAGPPRTRVRLATTDAAGALMLVRDALAPHGVEGFTAEVDVD